MRKAIVILLALSLSGCAGFNPLTVIKNPISATNLYQAELVFDGAVKTFNSLKGLCASRVLPPKCRTYVVQGQGYIRQAAAADIAARNFVANNPTLDATNVVQAFTGIVGDFQNTVTALAAK
jgi:hypothetical protein